MLYKNNYFCVGLFLTKTKNGWKIKRKNNETDTWVNECDGLNEKLKFDVMDSINKIWGHF